DRKPDLLVETFDIATNLLATTLDTMVFGAGFTKFGARLFGGSIDLADCLFDYGKAVGAFGLFEGRVGDASDEPSHAGQDAFVNHDLLLGWKIVRRDADAQFIGALLKNETRRKRALPALAVTHDVERHRHPPEDGVEGKQRWPLDCKKLVVERQPVH